jgi:uncharacterized membrane protein (UPF0127 family)
VRAEDLLDAPARAPRALRRVAVAADTEVGTRRLQRAIALLALLGLAALFRAGTARPRDPFLVNEPVPSKVPGFPQVAFRVRPGATGTAASGPSLCALLADTEQRRQTGLMARHDLGGYDGMVFRFPAQTTSSFYMRNTPLPLSIAWFDASGRFVGSADMAPCPDRPDCPLYGPNRPYLFGLEVTQGGLKALGVGPGSSIAVGGACAGH